MNKIKPYLANDVVPLTDEEDSIKLVHPFWLPVQIMSKFPENSSTDVHFCWSPVIDRLKSSKTYCSKPHQDLGLIQKQFWWSHVPFFTTMLRTSLATTGYCFPNAFKVSGQQQNTDVLISTSGLQGHQVLAEVSSHV